MKPIASSPKRLQPLSYTIAHDGAPLVPLSPHKGLRNAYIIYQAIRTMPDKTLIRGDFDRHAKPFIYFPQRPQKELGLTRGMQLIAEANIRAGREEFAGFLASIVEAFNQSPCPTPAGVQARIDMSFRSEQVMQELRDFTVGDVKDSLRKMAHAYRIGVFRQATSGLKMGRDSGKLQVKRLKEFAGIRPEMLGLLRDALGEGLNLASHDTRPALAVQAMKKLIDGYLAQKSGDRHGFKAFLRSQVIGADLLFFAKRWMAISAPPYRGIRKLLCTESWAKELEVICPSIIAAAHAGVRVCPDNRSTGGLLYRRQAPPGQLPGTPEDERRLRNAIRSLAKLPALDLDDKYSSLIPRPSSGEPSASTLQPPQIVPGIAIAASAHEVPAVQAEPARSGKTKVFARLVANHESLVPEEMQSHHSENDLDRIGPDAGYFNSDSSSAQAKSVDALAQVTRKLSAHSGLTYSSIALPKKSMSDSGPVRTANTLAMYPKQGYSPDEASTTDEEQ